MSKNLKALRETLLAAVAVKRDNFEDEQTFLIEVVREANDLSDDDFDKLPEGAQDWLNDAAKAFKAKKDLPTLGTEDPVSYTHLTLPTKA